MSVEVINTISPSTNETVITRNGLSAADLDLLPKVATEAFQSFRKTSLKERQEIVKKFLKGLSDRKDELAEELTVQMGRPIAFGAKEVETAIKRGEYLLKISDEALQDTDGEAEKGFKRFIRKVPVGPVLVIFAWNVSSSPFDDQKHATDSISVSLPDPGQFPDPRHSGRKFSDSQAVPANANDCRTSIQGF